MTMHTTARRFRHDGFAATLLLAIAAISVSASATPNTRANANAKADTGAVNANDPRFFPLPGLYRFKMVTDTTEHHLGNAQSRNEVDSASASERVTSRHPDGTLQTRMYQGDAPVEMCLKPTGTVSVPPGMEIGGCDTNKPRIVGGSLAWTHSCPWGKVDMTMRRIDSSTWETTSNTATYEEDGDEESGGMEVLTEMAEDMLKTGTPEERAEARQYLEENKVLIAEQKARARAPTPPVKAAVTPRQGTVKHTMKSVTYMTRIGNCKG